MTSSGENKDQTTLLEVFSDTHNASVVTVFIEGWKNVAWNTKQKRPLERPRNTRSVYRVCVLTLLLRVGTSWRCGDGLFFEVPPVASDALLTTLHPLLENVLQTVDHFEISCLGARFSWLERPRNLMGRDLDCMGNVLMGFHRSNFCKPNTEFSSVLWWSIFGCC
jgi:hypothetical protein